MVNRAVLPDRAAWPERLKDLADPRFKDAVACAALVETTTVAQFAALRVVRGDAHAKGLLDALIANGMRVYASNLRGREALARERKAVAIANASNIHVFYLEGNPVGEAWLDQEDGGIGTHVEAHTIAVLAGAGHPAEARAFVDFLLSAEVQTLLARRFGETPVKPAAEHGTVRPLERIARMDAPLPKLARLDEGLRASGPLLRRVLGGVEPGRPGVAQDVDVLHGVAACAIAQITWSVSVASTSSSTATIHFV